MLFVLAPSFLHYASVTVLKATLLFTEKHATMKCFSFMSLGNTFLYKSDKLARHRLQAICLSPGLTEKHITIISGL